MSRDEIHWSLNIDEEMRDIEKKLGRARRMVLEDCPDDVLATHVSDRLKSLDEQAYNLRNYLERLRRQEDQEDKEHYSIYVYDRDRGRWWHYGWRAGQDEAVEAVRHHVEENETPAFYVPKTEGTESLLEEWDIEVDPAA